MLIEQKDFETAVNSSMSTNKLELCGNDTFITTNRDDTILVPQARESDGENKDNGNTRGNLKQMKHQGNIRRKHQIIN